MTWKGLGASFGYLGDYGACIDALLRALTKSPSREETAWAGNFVRWARSLQIFQLGLNAYKNHDYDTAIYYFEQANQMLPSAHYTEAIQLARDAKEAATHYQAPAPTARWQAYVDLPPVDSVNRRVDGLGVRKLEPLDPTSEEGKDVLDKLTPAVLDRLIVTKEVGDSSHSILVTGLRPAVEELAKVLALVRRDYPDLFASISKIDGYVVRSQRNSDKPSLHSWGIAFDFYIGGVAQPQGLVDGERRAFAGYVVLGKYFNDAGFYWGGGYHHTSRTDPHHFEASLGLMEWWRSLELF